jgi:hypothetical protein
LNPKGLQLSTSDACAVGILNEKLRSGDINVSNGCVNRSCFPSTSNPRTPHRCDDQQSTLDCDIRDVESAYISLGTGNTVSQTDTCASACQEFQSRTITDMDLTNALR